MLAPDMAGTKKDCCYRECSLSVGNPRKLFISKVLISKWVN